MKTIYLDWLSIVFHVNLEISGNWTIKGRINPIPHGVGLHSTGGGTLGLRLNNKLGLSWAKLKSSWDWNLNKTWFLSDRLGFFI